MNDVCSLLLRLSILGPCKVGIRIGPDDKTMEMGIVTHFDEPINIMK